MSDDENSKVVKAEKKPFVTRSLYDVQRIRLEKLMKNPDKPVEIPERRKEKAIPEPPDFVRNVMGSSAGAGSGEFHVYRHIRRREYARQRHIKIIAEKEEKDSQYQQKLEENKRIADEKTAKRRAKRLKKKQKAKKPKKGGNNQKSESESDDSEESSQEENDILDKDNDASRDAKDSAKFDVKDKADTDLSQDIKVDGPSLNDAEKSNS